MNNKVLIKNYFEIGDDKSIYPATGFKRFSAKLLDILIVNLFVFILFLIKNNVVLSDEGYLMKIEAIPLSYYDLLKVTRVDSLPFVELLISQWDFRIMIFQVTSIFMWVFFLIIVPIINFKNKGQSLGKKVFSITPLYLDNKNKTIKIILREIPFIFIFSFSNIVALISGYEINIIISEYFNEVNVKDSNINDIMNSIGFNSFVISMFSFQSYLSLAMFIYILVVFFLLVKNPQKIAIHDKFVNEAIVDLKTIISTQEAENRYKVLLHSNYGFIDEQQKNLNNENNNEKEINDIDPKLENYENEKKEENIDIKFDKENNENLNNNNNEEKVLDSNNNDLELNNGENNSSPNEEKEQDNQKKLKEKNDDFSKLTVKELKELLDSKNIKFKSTMKKSELIELLKNK